MTHVIVEGLVQGVSFREYTRRQAFILHLNGWVRNQGDGSVEVMLYGADSDITKMLDWLRQGSPRSRVDNLRIRQEPATERFATFEIRF
jgi:acylphosphatase